MSFVLLDESVLYNIKSATMVAMQHELDSLIKEYQMFGILVNRVK